MFLVRGGLDIIISEFNQTYFNLTYLTIINLSSMKKVFLVVTVVIISKSLVLSQELTKDQRSVQNTILRLFDALSNRDSVALKAQCTADVLLFEYGKTWTIDTLIIKSIKENQSNNFKRVNKIDFISTSVDHDVAWATYKNQANIEQNDDRRILQWIETVILIRENEAWKIKVLHSTLLKRN